MRACERQRAALAVAFLPPFPMGSSPLFWILALALVAATLALLVVPLLRRARAADAPGDEAAATAVFRDHRRQIDAERDAGAITPDEHAASLAELTRRFGEELAATPAASSAPASRSGFVAALGLVALLPVTAGVLYFVLGNPAALAPQASRPAPTTNAQVDAMVEQLAARLKANPDDAEGWTMLGRAYRVMGRYEMAATAYAEAVKRMPDQAGLMADWAEAIGQVQGRSLAGQPTDILERALKIQPDNAKALALAGAAAMERGDRPRAIALWTRLRAVLPANSPQLAQIDQALAQAGITPAEVEGTKAAPPVAKSAPGTPPASGAPAGPGSQAKAATAPATKSAPAASITARIELDPRFAGNVSPSDTVFILARNPEGSRMPLAVIRTTVADLPKTVELNDAMAMAPGVTLSAAPRVVVEARVSKSGNAKAASGDLEGVSAPVTAGARDVRVMISRQLP